MPQIFLKSDSRTVCRKFDQHTTVENALVDCLGKPFKNADYYILSNGRKVHNSESIEDGSTYHVIIRLLGGKGGFGSMLRAIGAQIDKTTNRDACRDLSGRRMRDVNNEKNLREWVAKKAERERERERRRKERRERMLAVPHHKFEDPKYDQQKSQVHESLEDALTVGLEKAVASGSGQGRKRKAESERVSKESIKKACEWLGVNVDDLSDVDFSTDSSSESGDGDAGDSTGYPGASSLPTSDTGLHSDSGMGSTSAHVSSSEDRESMPPKELHLSDKPNIPGHPRDSDNGDNVTTTLDSKCNPNLLEQLAKVPPGEPDTPRELVAPPSQQGAPVKDADPINLDNVESVEELEAFGLDHLKADLMRRGLKCGGTLKERATRLFSVRGLTTEEIDRSLFAKTAKGKGRKK